MVTGGSVTTGSSLPPPPPPQAVNASKAPNMRVERCKVTCFMIVAFHRVLRRRLEWQSCNCAFPPPERSVSSCDEQHHPANEVWTRGGATAQLQRAPTEANPMCTAAQRKSRAFECDL